MLSFGRCGPDKAFRQELVSLKDEVEEMSHGHTATYPSLLSTATTCTHMHYAIREEGMACTHLMILLEIHCAGLMANKAG